jgi:signal transduction histidine kinase
VEVQQVLAAKAGLKLCLSVEHTLPDIWGDTQRLLQVFGNLIGNALKFTPRGGRITLGAGLQGNHVMFSVEDTGPGIPEALLSHVFDRFWQANRSDHRGAGLGLSIAKSIIDAHSGRITVESKAGCGATFRFTVPVAPSAREYG